MSYNAATLRYFRAAPGAGVLSGAGVGRGEAGARELGTWVQFDVRLQSGTIAAARFLAFGCPHTLAAAARVAERAPGHGPATALPETIEQLRVLFEVPVEKLGRLLVVEDAWLAALRAAAGAASP